MSLHQAEIDAGLRQEVYPDLSGIPYDTECDPKATALRVKWANNLRAIVSRRMPRNKMGTPMVSDVDLLFATEAERAEALRITIKK